MTFRVLLLLCFGVISLTAPVKPLWPVLVSASILASIIVALVWLREKPTVRDVLFLAILARLILFPLAPSLSDDGFRYVWDGMLQWEGINPFLHRPIDAAVEPFSGLALFSHLNSSEYFTVYPPLSQIFFVLGGWFPAESWFRSFLAIKLLVVGAEIGALYLLGQMVSARSLLLYAWNPLVVVETAGQAHTETLMVALLISTVWAYRNNRPKLSTVALSAAMWVKLYPVLFIPFLLRRVGWKFIWIPILVSGLLAGPYYAPGVITNCVESLKLYVGLFEFYSGPYLSLKWLAYRLGGHTGLEFVVGVSLAASYLAFIIWLYWTDGRKTWSLSQTLFLALAGLLVASTTIHPWYFLGLLAILPLLDKGVWPWLWLATFSTGTYLLYSNDIYWAFVWIGWTGWLLMILVGTSWPRLRTSAWTITVDSLMKRRGRNKAQIVAPFVPRSTASLSILDLGAGEGYVGNELVLRTGDNVTLCDVRDSNRTDLPFVRYDGNALPFDEDWFDVTLLIFTLHHCEDQLRVIREAARVTKGRIIIVESVYQSSIGCRLLSFFDQFANRVRSGGDMTEQESWLHFRTADEWLSLFEQEGFEILSIRRWGRIHKQALFVIGA